MVKAEWGAKRTCPKCGTRFYDLGKDEPVTCIDCGTAWEPEPVLKSKQPLPFEDKEKDKKEKKEEEEVEDEDLDIDEEEEENPDDEVDLGGDEEIAVKKTGEEDEES
ncbi:MAG: TIGR02300 family protein [Sphingomonadaceae bacterium]